MVKGNKGEALGFCYGEFMSSLKQIHNLLFSWSQFNFMEEGAVWNVFLEIHTNQEKHE